MRFKEAGCVLVRGLPEMAAAVILIWLALVVTVFLMPGDM